MTQTNTRASHGETVEEWITKAENMLRLTENAAEYATGVGKAILLRNADELQHHIRVAKRLAFTASELDCDWIDLRCKWIRKANVDGMPVGIVTDFMEALRRGIIQYVEEGDCDICDATNTYLTAIDGAAVCCDCMDSRLTVMEEGGL